MSSETRNPSAVRNLLSLFEQKVSLDPTSPDSRGRSPSSGVGGSSDKENGDRPRSKVRASFIPVGGMATVDDKKSLGARRGSFSEVDGDGALSDLKRTISEQQKRMLSPEGAVESAVNTPMKKPGEGRLGHDLPAENPDKPVTGEQDAVDMKPADPSSEEAVSRGDALAPVPEDLRSSKANGKKADTKKPTTNGKPAAISTKAPSKSSSSAVKSPASAKVSGSSTSAASPSLKAPAKKASRSSLTAPTAASLARTGAPSDKQPSTKTSPTSKPKPREVTKPISLPSHLTAPTASSRAKHEPESEPASSTSRPTTTSRPKATTPAKPTARSSTSQQPTSREASSTSRKSVNPSESSFLDRMTKPTTASANHRNAEKTESKAPSKSSKPATTSARPKVNGTKPASKSTHSAPPASAKGQETDTHDEESAAEDPAEATPALAITSVVTAAAAIGVGGTPLAKASKAKEPPNRGKSERKLESTPAAIGGEETIRKTIAAPGPAGLWGILGAS